MRGVWCGAWSAIAILAIAIVTPAGAGPLGDDPGGADPLRSLTEAQRSAAQALGDARRFVDAGDFSKARSALARTGELGSLGGYVDLVRVRLLMGEGAHAKAYQTATAALDGSESRAVRAALGVLQGEALAMGGDTKGAELAWSGVFDTTVTSSGAVDNGARQSVELLIVAARQRTGSLDPSANPLVLLDQNYAGLVKTAPATPLHLLEPSDALDRAAAALDAGHPEQALAFYDHALSKKLDPTMQRRAASGRAKALFRARKYDAATKAYTALLPDLEARFWLARSFARTGKVEASLAEFARVAEGSNDDLASWSLYLSGTLREDRGEMSEAIADFQRASEYKRFSDRVRSALWRKGWAEYRTKAYANARQTYRRLVDKTDDPLDALRPRYWAARAAILSGDTKSGRDALAEIARTYPLTYYGWRAKERLSIDGTALVTNQYELVEGTQGVDDESIERAALLIEGGLSDLARDELRFALRDARGFADRTRLGILLARVGDYHRASELVVNAYAESLARGLQQGRETLWWLSWPPAYRETILEAFPENASIEPELVWAIMREESLFQVDARSSVGALSLLQLMPATATELASEKGMAGFKGEDLFDPKTNITLGALYLDQLASRFDGRMSAAIGSYNAGAYRVSQWLEGEARTLDDDVWVENIPYDQTRAYVKRVMRSLHVYKTFYR